MSLLTLLFTCGVPFCRCWLLSSLIWRLPTRAFVMLVGWKSSFQSELSLQPNSTVGFYNQLFRKIVFLMICELLVALSPWYDFTTLHMPSPQTDGGDWSSYHVFWSKAVVFNHMDSPYFFFEQPWWISSIWWINGWTRWQCPGDRILYQGIPDHRWLVRWKAEGWKQMVVSSPMTFCVNK